MKNVFTEIVENKPETYEEVEISYILDIDKKRLDMFFYEGSIMILEKDNLTAFIIKKGDSTIKDTEGNIVSKGHGRYFNVNPDKFKDDKALYETLKEYNEVGESYFELKLMNNKGRKILTLKSYYLDQIINIAFNVIKTKTENKKHFIENEGCPYCNGQDIEYIRDIETGYGSEFNDQLWVCNDCDNEFEVEIVLKAKI